MKKVTSDQRGSSLIEVLAASAILCVITIVAGSFFFSNLLSFKTANTSITLEREGRTALNAITDTIRENAKVNTPTPIGPLNDGFYPVDLLEFYNGTKLEVYGNELQLITVSGGTTVTTVLSRTLKTLQVGSIPTADFASCKGLRIKLTLSQDSKEINIESEAYFRNTR